MNLIIQLDQNEFVRGLLKIPFVKDKVCEACQMGKQIKTSLKTKFSVILQDPLSIFIWIFLDPQGLLVLEENHMHYL